MLLHLVVPALVLYGLTTAYLDRRQALGGHGARQLFRRLLELCVGAVAAAWFSKAADAATITSNSRWAPVLPLAGALYGVALAVTGLLHILHLLQDKPGTPYRIGWVLFWLATLSLVLIILLGLLFPFGLFGGG
jgi:hypothetical protein